jgi:hypothetical protein
MSERELFLCLTGVFTGFAGQSIVRREFWWWALYQVMAIGTLWHAGAVR